MVKNELHLDVTVSSLAGILKGKTRRMESTSFAILKTLRNVLKVHRRTSEGGDVNEALADLGRHDIPPVLTQVGARL